ncbi:hypothetical protein ETB97_011438 [Aspergillus alliaceus]|uniref:Cyclochlorotine biosynthesis protein O n=1 Tax=Petromyces alliaceus TaxID=209559 RepID=A0A8H6EC74_PETAA|nr:hypothetical protein ETB97_011438 [Aspergillus burnettii]
MEKLQCDNHQNQENEYLLAPPERRQYSILRTKRLLVLLSTFTILCILLIVDIAIRLKAGRCTTGPLTYFDRHINNKYITNRFTDDVNSPFRSASPEGQAAWDEVMRVEFFRITETEVSAIGAPLSSVKLPKSRGGGYLANLAVFHQLHCVRILWEATRMEYFESRENVFYEEESEAKVHEHLDHCADIVRQALMCHADTTIITWGYPIEGTTLRPNYSLPRTCRDYDSIIAWGRENEIHYP